MKLGRAVQGLLIASLAAALAYVVLQAVAMIHLVLHLLGAIGEAAGPALSAYVVAGGEQAAAPEGWLDQSILVIDILLSHGLPGLLLALGILGFAAFALWLRTAPGRRAWGADRLIAEVRTAVEEELAEAAAPEAPAAEAPAPEPARRRLFRRR